MILNLFDPILTDLVGALPPEAEKKISREAISAFCGGLEDEEVKDLVRARHWITRGHPRDCSSEHMIDVLAGRPLPLSARRHLALLVDEAYRESQGRQTRKMTKNLLLHQRWAAESSRHRWIEETLLGRRLALVAAVLSIETDATGLIGEQS